MTLTAVIDVLRDDRKSESQRIHDALIIARQIMARRSEKALEHYYKNKKKEEKQ